MIAGRPSDTVNRIIPSRAHTPAKALIIAESEANRASFTRLLEQVRDCEAYAFNSMEGALLWAIPNRPDIIIAVDAKPGHAGLDFLRRTTTVQELIPVPKLFIHSNDPDARRSAVALGATDVSTPSDPREVLERINNLLALSRARTTLFEQMQEAQRQLRASETRSVQYVRRLETLYKASTVESGSDDERFARILNAGALALRDGGRFLGVLSRIHNDTTEVLSVAEGGFETAIVKAVPKAGERTPLIGSLEALFLTKDSTAVWDDLWNDPAAVGLARVRGLGLRSAVGTVFEIENDRFCVYFVSRAPAGEQPFGEGDQAFVELLASILTMLLTERKRTAQLRWQAERDDLTGLVNRVTFRKRLARAIETAKDRRFAVLILDLDHFQEINDSLGHPVGDAVLVAVGQRLQRAMNRGELLARMGGDEFAVSFTVADAAAAETRAKELRALFEQPFQAAGMPIVVGTTIGIALYPDHATDVEDLLPRSDAALYQAKRDERGTIRLFDPAIAARLEKRRTLQGELRDALAGNQFVLFFQPEVDLKTGTLIAAEALIRWRHPERGLVGPGEFIPFAEESAMIRHIGAWTVERACEHIPSLTRENRGFRVYVNLSAGQLSDPLLHQYLIEEIEGRQVPVQNIGFEITESMAMRDPKLTLTTVGTLKDHGFRIAIDDFGTGYSSLAYLSSLDPDVVKIDKSFVDGIPAANVDSGAIIETVVHFARKTERLVLAEGVEHLSQMAWLHAAGVNYVQGYHVGRPMPVNEFLMWARRWKAAHQVGTVRPWHGSGAEN